MSFTEADFNSWRFNRDAVHFNGGAVFFGWGHRCVTQPRLLVIDKYFKKDRSTKRSYVVDGKTPCETLEQALTALAVSPILTGEEVELLKSVTDDWSRPERRVDLLPLGEMGFVEWGISDENKVTCRRTDAGRTALSSTDRK